VPVGQPTLGRLNSAASCLNNRPHYSRANAVSPTVAYSWKVLASGHAAEYAYELGLLEGRLPFT